MTDARTAAIEVAALKALLDEVKTQYDAAKHRAMAVLDAGDRKLAVLPDGQDIGTVSIAKGRVTAKVTGPDVLTAWVKEGHPSEVETETVERVRESFVGALIGRAENVDGKAIDRKTGEVIPGLVFSGGEPYVSVRLTDEQRKAFVRAWIDGKLRIQLGALLGAPSRPRL